MTDLGSTSVVCTRFPWLAVRCVVRFQYNSPVLNIEELYPFLLTAFHPPMFPGTHLDQWRII